ncbi:MAG: methyltransferase domain-containing protein [Pseudomonadota bacterium]
MSTLQDVTHDTVFQGRVKLVQPAKGLRATTDSLLLAASVAAKPGAHLLEFGTGCGGALLPAAWRSPEVAFTGLELEPDLAALARQGAQENGFGDRVSVIAAEASAWVRDHENRFDCIFANPPFFEPGRISPPGDKKTGAYIASLSLEDWLKAMVFAAKPRAPVIVLHRAAELARLLAPLDRWGGEITVLPIHPRPGQPANRVLVRMRKGLRRGDARLLPGLCLHADGTTDAPGPVLQAVRQGLALDWD